MAEEVEVHPEKIREFISYLLGFADAAGEIPGFLGGKGGGHSVWLMPSDLGDIHEFYQSWINLCGWRLGEAKELEQILLRTAEALADGLAAFTRTDQDIAASFPAVDEKSFAKDLREKGLVIDGEPPKVSSHAPR